MSQKMPLNDFKWTEDISEIDESFIKSYNEESGIFNTQEIYITFTSIYYFYLKEW